MRLDSSGNLGIGTSTPTSPTTIKSNSESSTSSGLTIQRNSGTDNIFALGERSNGKARFHMYSDGVETIALYTDGTDNYINAGNLGIGTSTPTAKLQVKDSSDSGFDSGIGITRSASTQTGYINMVGGAMNFNSPAIPFTFRQSGLEKMRLDTLGRLGIGTTNPSRDGLNVFHTTTPYVHLTNTTTGDTSSDGGYLALAGTELRLGNQEASGDLNMFVDNDSTVGIIIKSGGNVGVGTSSPIGKMEISSSNVRATANGGADELVLQNNDFCGMSIFSSDSTAAQILFGDSSSSVRGLLQYYNSTDAFVFGTAGAERMRLDVSGNLTIGSTTNAGYKLKVEGSGTVQLNNRLVNDGAVFAAAHQGTVVGTISVTASATAYNTTSDYRLKEDLQDFKGLELVSKIPVYDYKWKAEDSRSYGVMAHELEEVLPQAVSGEKDAEEMQSVDYSKIVPLLIKSIQELTAKVEKLELNK